MKFLYKRFHILFLSAALLLAPINANAGLLDRVAYSFGKLFTCQFKQMNSADYQRIITTSAFGAVLGYGIYWYFFKDRNTSKHVEFAKVSNNFAYNRALNERVTLRQMRVAGQYGATCGYHALKNGILVANALHAGDITHLQKDLLDNSISEKLIADWRSYVNNRRTVLKRTIASGENLYGDEIIDLIAIEQGKYPHKYAKHSIKRTLKNKQCGFTIYDTTAQIGTEFDSEIAEIKKTLGRNREYTHVFVMNTLGVTDNYKAGAHWYTVVLHQNKNGKREYIAMDTGGLQVKHSTGIKKLITVIEGALVAALI